MSFYNEMKQYDKTNVYTQVHRATEQDVLRVLAKENLTINDMMLLLSPAAGNYLEEMAKKALAITIRHFGRAVILYAPLYLSNYCVNDCLYCGFNVHQGIDRRKLTLEEAAIEAARISENGIRHILILTGESRKHSPVSYIKDCAKELSKRFSSISIEVYPLETEEYRELVENGVDGLTLYQEVYDEEIYNIMHPKGPKKDYLCRLDAPERGCMAGMRSVGIGALLGLGEWRTEAFYTMLHAYYLTRKYPEIEISISLPRMRPHGGSFQTAHPVNDRAFVQILLAVRLFLNHIGITVSTRERPEFRDNLVGLGITKMSAGSVTEVGGYSEKKGDGQFVISDERSVEEVRQMLYHKGFQPVFKDWQTI